MNISLLDVVGPVMVGPSSSHTAGAVRIGRVSRAIAEKPFDKVTFKLHGSFAKTYKGHGTDKALLAGVMGLSEADERIVDAYKLADERKLVYQFEEIQLENVHENTVHIVYELTDGTICTVTGSSVGGGRILICNVNGYIFEFTAENFTLLISHKDQKGVISEIARILADGNINIGTLKLSRSRKGEMACSLIETDDWILPELRTVILGVEAVLSVQVINIV